MLSCYCCSGRSFSECCGPAIKGILPVTTAEALMRSRYSAYVLADVNYLLQTTHASERKYYSADAIEQWAKSSIWISLEIIYTEKGAPADAKGIVEFKARFLDEQKCMCVHHEYSSFVKEGGKWFFLKGEIKK